MLESVAQMWCVKIFFSFKFGKLWAFAVNLILFSGMKSSPGSAVRRIFSLQWILLILYLNEAKLRLLVKGDIVHSLCCLHTIHSFYCWGLYMNSQQDRSWTGTVFSVNQCQFTQIVSIYNWAPALAEDNAVC